MKIQNRVTISLLLSLALLLWSVPSFAVSACETESKGDSSCPMHQARQDCTPQPMAADHECCKTSQGAKAPEPEPAKEKCQCAIRGGSAKDPVSTPSAAPAPSFLVVDIPELPAPPVGLPLLELREPGVYANDSGPPGTLVVLLSHLRAPPIRCGSSLG